MEGKLGQRLASCATLSFLKASDKPPPGLSFLQRKKITQNFF